MLPLTSNRIARLKWRSIGAELADRAAFAAVYHLEVPGLQASHESPPSVADRRTHRYEIDARPEHRLGTSPVLILRQQRARTNTN